MADFDPWETPAASGPSANLDPWETKGGKAEDPRYSGPIGAITRMSDNLLRMMAEGATFGGNKAIAAGTQKVLGATDGSETMEGQRAITAQTREETGALGTAAEIAGGIGSGMLIPGGAVNTLGKALMTGAGTGVVTTTGQTYFDTGEMPTTQQVVAGGLLGAGAGAVGYGLGRLMQRPNLDADTMKKVNLLNQEGIDVTSGQATGSATMLRREAGATGAPELYEKQLKNFSKAALRRAGIMADDGRLDPMVLDDAFKITGGRMDKLAANNNMMGPEGKKELITLMRQTADIAHNYKQGVEATAPIIDNAYKQIAKAAKRGTFSGDDFQRITSELEAAARGNPRLAPYAREARRAIQDAMERYISVTNPADAQLWKAVNRQYSNLLVVQEAFTRAGRDAANGLITPSNLAASTKMLQGKTRFARNMTDFDDLARAGAAILRPLPVGAHANPQEIAKLVGRKLTAAATTGGTALLGGMGPLAAGASAIGGLVASEGLSSIGGRLATMPVTSLSPTAAQTGAKIGVSVGNAANPFTRASRQQ